MDRRILTISSGGSHPLGCTGAKLTVQIIHELRRRKKKYGMVTACVGGGQGISGIIELLNSRY